MVAMIGFILRINSSDGGVDWRSIAAVAIILLNLYMCGSRRSYALLIVLYVFLCFFVIVKKDKRIARGFFVTTLLMFSAIYISSDALISSEAVDKYKIISPVGSPSGRLEGDIFTYTPQDLVSSVSSDQSFGLSSRLVRWGFAFDLLAHGDWLFGDGFSYQDKYSCRFSECRTIDYPHNIFLSEWLLAGVLGALAMVFLFCMIFFEMVRCRREAVTSGVLLILFVVLPGAFISGDGIFSVPQVLVSIMMAFIYSYGEGGVLLRFPESGGE